MHKWQLVGLFGREIHLVDIFWVGKGNINWYKRNLYEFIKTYWEVPQILLLWSFNYHIEQHHFPSITWFWLSNIHIKFLTVQCGQFWYPPRRPMTANHIATSRTAWSSRRIVFLRFMVSVNGLVPVRHLTKTFASGKTEKMVYQVELFKMITMIMMMLWMINTKEMLWWQRRMPITVCRL